jgi:predicted nucleic acid-binding protein
MGLIPDSSVLIQGERESETVAQLLKKVVNSTGNQETALSAVALVELAHGIGYAIVTGNPHHFQMIPNLTVKLL